MAKNSCENDIGRRSAWPLMETTGPAPRSPMRPTINAPDLQKEAAKRKNKA